MRWQSGTECSALETLQPSTGKAPSRGIQSSKGRALTPSKSSSKLRAGNSPSFRSILSAKRERILALARPLRSVLNRTRPFSGSTASMPMCLSSLPSGPSRPKRQLAHSSSGALSIAIPPVLSTFAQLLRILYFARLVNHLLPRAAPHAGQNISLVKDVAI